jgi:hypothetical protein
MFSERVAGGAGHRREALVDAPPDTRVSGGELTLDPGHPKLDPPNLELLRLVCRVSGDWSRLLQKLDFGNAV